MMERVREGANVWFTLPPRAPGWLVHDLLARLPADDAVLAGDRRGRPRACWRSGRASRRTASAGRGPSGTRRMRSACRRCGRAGACWPCCRPAAGPAAGYRHRHRPAAGAAGAARAVRGWAWTPAGRCWRWPAPAWPSRNSRTAPCARRTCIGCRCRWRVRLGGAADGAALRRGPGGRAWPRPRGCCGPGGRLLIVDWLQHGRADLLDRLAHRWPGFHDGAIRALLRGCRAWSPGRPGDRAGPARRPPLARHAACRTRRPPTPRTLPTAKRTPA